MVAYTFLLKAFEYLRRGRTAMSVPYTMPQEAIGVGFWEAGRGILTHHVVLDHGRIANYQIVTPSTWMASPQDPFGAPGPYEEAVLNTPLLEEFTRPEDFTGIEFAQGTSVGTGADLEFYMNFGTQGIVIGFALLGFFLMRLDQRLTRALAVVRSVREPEVGL